MKSPPGSSPEGIPGTGGAGAHSDTSGTIPPTGPGVVRRAGHRELGTGKETRAPAGEGRSTTAQRPSCDGSDGRACPATGTRCDPSSPLLGGGTPRGTPCRPPTRSHGPGWGVSQNAGERGRGGQERPAGPGRAVPAGHSALTPAPSGGMAGGVRLETPPPGPAPSPLSPPGTQELLASPGLSERTRGRLPAPPGADAPRESRCSRADRPTDRPPRSRPRRPLPGPPRPWLRRRHRGAPCRGLPAPGAAAARRSRAEMQRVRPSGSPHPSPYPPPPRDPPEPGSGGDGTGGGPGPGSQLGFGGSSSGLRLRPTSPRVRGSAVALVARVRGPGNWGGACARIAVPAWRPPPPGSRQHPRLLRYPVVSGGRGGSGRGTVPRSGRC